LSADLRYEEYTQGSLLSIKRVLGENLLSKKFKAQKVEAGLKVMLYNKFISL
jgi:hypothetical protein